LLPSGAIVLAFDRVQPLLADENYPAQTCDDISALIARHSRALRQIFRRYAQLSLVSLLSDSWSMADWLQFCDESALSGDGTTMPRTAFKRVFFAALDTERRAAKGLKSDDYTAPELYYLDFIQALILIAGERSLSGTLIARLMHVVESHVVPMAVIPLSFASSASSLSSYMPLPPSSFSSPSPASEFRRQLSSDALKQLLIGMHGAALLRLFKQYGAQDRRTARGGVVARAQLCTLSVREFVLMMRDTRMLAAADGNGGGGLELPSPRFSGNATAATPRSSMASASTPMSPTSSSSSSSSLFSAIGARGLSEATARAVFLQKAAECVCGSLADMVAAETSANAMAVAAAAAASAAASANAASSPAPGGKKKSSAGSSAAAIPASATPATTAVVAPKAAPKPDPEVHR
jgi:hypothetical protein